MSRPAGDGAGAARRKEEVTRFRVRYPEVDRMNVAHHMHYLAWFEMGRTELMRAAGVPYGRVEEELGVRFPVVAAAARYRRSSRYDEELEVRTSLADFGGPRVRFEYRVLRPADDALLAEGFTVHASIGPDGRPHRIPAPLRDALARWEAS